MIKSPNFGQQLNFVAPEYSLGFTPLGGVSDSNEAMRHSFHDFVDPIRMREFMKELSENTFFGEDGGLAEREQETAFKVIKYWQERCDQVEVSKVKYKLNSSMSNLQSATHNSSNQEFSDTYHVVEPPQMKKRQKNKLFILSPGALDAQK